MTATSSINRIPTGANAIYPQKNGPITSSISHSYPLSRLGLESDALCLQLVGPGMGSAAGTWMCIGDLRGAGITVGLVLPATGDISSARGGDVLLGPAITMGGLIEEPEARVWYSWDGDEPDTRPPFTVSVVEPKRVPSLGSGLFCFARAGSSCGLRILPLGRRCAGMTVTVGFAVPVLLDARSRMWPPASVARAPNRFQREVFCAGVMLRVFPTAAAWTSAGGDARFRLNGFVTDCHLLLARLRFCGDLSPSSSSSSFGSLLTVFCL